MSGQAPAAAQASVGGAGADKAPSIRLNLGVAAAASTNAAAAAPAAPSAATSSNKARKTFTPTTTTPSTTAHIARASDVSLLHQATQLDLCFHDNAWTWHGRSTLYVIGGNDAAVGNASNDNSATDNTTTTAVLDRQLALHLRGCCVIDSMQAYMVQHNESTPTMQPVHTTFQHLDPLAIVLRKPAASHVVDGDHDDARHHADAQSTRGAAGFTTGLRVASIASYLGEVRVTVRDDANPASLSDTNELEAVWKADLAQAMHSDGACMTRLQSKLRARHAVRREARLQRIAFMMAAAASTSSNTKRAAMKIVVDYHIPMYQPHMGGLHALSSCSSSIPHPPHLYTTAGTHGDHEGARCWLPTLDSASVRHRATHQLCVCVTAAVPLGLHTLGSGEDAGATVTLLHEPNWHVADARQELGARHVDLVQSVWSPCDSMDVDDGENNAPPARQQTNTTALSSLRATHVWCNSIWTPISCRSLGFCVGPWKVLEDPEYFGPILEGEIADGDDDDDDAASGAAVTLVELIKAAHENGEGIRNAYFCPLFERKYIHVRNGSMTLLPPHTQFRLQSLSAAQQEQSMALNETIVTSTVGVPHRALTLMKDVLAVPAFRTVSYTQIWIPGAVHGGLTSGSLSCCPEVMVNPFLGGSIMDSGLLPPQGGRLPYYQGGQALQFLQARSAVRGWITASLPLGGGDDVGNGYILALFEAFLMSLYERGHGAYGEGGAKGSVFHSKRFAATSGLNNTGLDFFPVQNIEDVDILVASIGAVPVEDRQNDQLWRSATNGTESHTSAMDEHRVRHLLCKDVVEALERGTDKDKTVPSPSLGWFGSHLSLSFLSSNATSSSEFGCGAMELMHPIGGLVYRSLKAEVFRSIVEGRAGVSSLVRLVRATFLAAHLEDCGEKELKLPSRRKRSESDSQQDAENANKAESAVNIMDGFKPPFVVCVNEILKKRGLTHTLFTRALQNLAGRLREPHMLGTLVDAERHAQDPRNNGPFVDPEGFPNSYVRGASLPYCRVGVQVEQGREGTASQAQSAAMLAKSVQVQIYAEPVIPEGGIAFGGPITVRIVENEGQLREIVKDLALDGSRRDWGATFLHAKPVTTAKAQTAASGTIESPDKSKQAERSSIFTDDFFHRGGYQAIELVRLTNLTPLLWVRVDPHGLYGGRMSVSQPDACLAEQLFHDGDAAAQLEAVRALAERPSRIQGSVKVTAVHDVNVAELPVRILGDCLRGSPALHSSLAHTPAIRVQAAFAIAQWQNNKAPQSKDSRGVENWIGLHLLMHYFRERFTSGNAVLPIQFTRLCLKKSGTERRQNANATEGTSANNSDDNYQYFDQLEEEKERKRAMANAEDVELEEDEEYRVRSAVVTAIAAIRAKDGMTPLLALEFLEHLLQTVDADAVSQHPAAPETLVARKKKRTKAASGESRDDEGAEKVQLIVSRRQYVASTLVADALLALCFVNVGRSFYTDPGTGQRVQLAGDHPITKLMIIAKGWVDWELYREKIRLDTSGQSNSDLGGNCHDVVAACAIVASSNLAILRQTTSPSEMGEAPKGVKLLSSNSETAVSELCSADYYARILGAKPRHSDVTRAASVQAFICVCCAADRFESEGVPPFGLLTALDTVLDIAFEHDTSPGLRQSLALIMTDACTGKVCSMQRVGAIAGRNDFVGSAARFLHGPLGPSYGGDNGSAMLTSVNAASFPAASAVNDGARRGLRLLSRAGHPREAFSEEAIVKVALFATKFWRAMNGERQMATKGTLEQKAGVCSYDGALRCTLLALWQWIWPRGCLAVLQVQAWKSHEGSEKYSNLGAHLVMKVTEEEKTAAAAEETAFESIDRMVNHEIDRQAWRGEMYRKAYDIFKAGKATPGVVQDVAAAEQGIGQPLPPIQRDLAFKQGGWIASAAQQRRAMALDGGTAVTKLRLTVKGGAGNEE